METGPGESFLVQTPPDLTERSQRQERSSFTTDVHAPPLEVLEGTPQSPTSGRVHDSRSQHICDATKRLPISVPLPTHTKRSSCSQGQTLRTVPGFYVPSSCVTVPTGKWP